MNDSYNANNMYYFIYETTNNATGKRYRGKRSGGNNPNAESVVDGVSYACKKDSAIALGVSKYMLNKLLKNKEI